MGGQLPRNYDSSQTAVIDSVQAVPWRHVAWVHQALASEQELLVSLFGIP
jgi:hypothetical protein